MALGTMLYETYVGRRQGADMLRGATLNETCAASLSRPSIFAWDSADLSIYKMINAHQYQYWLLTLYLPVSSLNHHAIRTDAKALHLSRGLIQRTSGNQVYRDRTCFQSIPASTTPLASHTSSSVDTILMSCLVFTLTT